MLEAGAIGTAKKDAQDEHEQKRYRNTNRHDLPGHQKGDDHQGKGLEKAGDVASGKHIGVAGTDDVGAHGVGDRAETLAGKVFPLRRKEGPDEVLPQARQEPHAINGSDAQSSERQQRFQGYADGDECRQRTQTHRYSDPGEKLPD